jgi:hypothetical protein
MPAEMVIWSVRINNSEKPGQHVPLFCIGLGEEYFVYVHNFFRNIINA